MSKVSVVPHPGAVEAGPLVLVVGSDLDAVADVAEDLEGWGHDPIVHFDVDGVASTIRRVRPDVVVVVGEPLAAVASLMASVGEARLVGYLGGGVSPARIPQGIRVATTPDGLREIVEGPAPAGTTVAPAPAVGRGPGAGAPTDDLPGFETEDAGTAATSAQAPPPAGPAGWVRVLVAAAILVIVASLAFAPPSEEDYEVTDDAPAQEEVVEDESSLDVEALAIPSVAPQAPIAVTPVSGATDARSGFGGVVVRRDGGAPIADARVVVTGPSGRLEAVTDADGRWRVADVRGGMYVVEASAPGANGAPVQVLVGDRQVVNGVRVALDEGAPPR